MFSTVDDYEKIFSLTVYADGVYEGAIMEESPSETESHPTVSGKGFMIPIRAPTRAYPGEGIIITFLFKEDFVIRNLIRKLLYKGVTVLEWFILFRNLEKNLKIRRPLNNALLFGMLNLSSSTRMSLDDWHFQTKAVIKSEILSRGLQILDNGEKQSFLEYIISSFRVPAAFREVFTFKTVTIPFIEPIKPLVIGVGYKDHGSLKPQHKWLPFVREYSPPSPNLFSLCKHEWEDLLRMTTDPKIN